MTSSADAWRFRACPLFSLPFILGLLSLLLAPRAHSQAQTDIVTPTGWSVLAGASVQAVNQQVGQGMRIVDLEIEDDSPLTMTTILVPNTGDYAKAWWWYTGLTVQEVNQRLTANQARLIDLEPYETSAGLRFAVVMIRNTGADFASDHGFLSGLTPSTLSAWLSLNQTRRIIDLEAYVDQGATRYSVVFVENSGAHQSPYWIYTGINWTTLTANAAANQARLLDIEVDDNTGLYCCLMVPEDGNRSLFFQSLRLDELTDVPLQEASRPIDIGRYTGPGGTDVFTMVIRRNADDLTVEATDAMRSQLFLNVPSGFLLQEYGANPQVVSGVFHDRAFEPLGLLSWVYHFVAHRQVSLGNLVWQSLIIDQTGTDPDGCPNGTLPVGRSLNDTVRRMSEAGSATAAKAIQDRIGISAIEWMALLSGAPGVDIRHAIGCLCGSIQNQVTLDDLAALQGAVISGVLGSETDGYYDRMDNSLEFGGGGQSTVVILNAELSQSSLSPAERDLFLADVYVAQRKSTESCPTGQGIDAFGARGVYLRLSERSGCDIVAKEYFLGAWVNENGSHPGVNTALSDGLAVLFRECVRRALHTWETANCSPFNQYCQANANSTGVPAVVIATGSSYIAQNDLVLQGTQMPTSSFASVIFGDARAFVSLPGGSAGNLCVGGNIGRLFDSIGTTNAGGTITFDVDNGALSFSSTGPFTLMAGDQLMFQWWYRDSSPTGPTSNFTNAVEVLFF